MADTENVGFCPSPTVVVAKMKSQFVSQLPQPTRHTLPSPQKQLTELSASAHNSRNAMPPPTFLGHKRQGSNLPEPASKRATLAERAGQPIRSIPAAPRSNAPVHPTVMSTTQSRNPSSFSQSQRINSHFSKSTSISATPSSFSASVGSGIRPPSIHASSSLARPKSSLAKEKAARGADARPATALGTRGGNQNGPNKQAWDPEEQYGNMERMYEDVCRHYKQAMEDNVEAKEINISYKSTIANLERERKELTESMIALRCELETTKYRLEAAERAAQELRRDNEEEVEELKREHRIDSENMRQSHREDLDRLKADHREEIRELKRRLEDELEAERSQRLQALAQVSTQGALEKQRHEMDLQSKEQEIRTINMEIERLKADLEREKMLNNDLRQNLATAGTNAVSMESARQALQAKIEFLESDNKSQSEAYAVMERRMNEALEKAAECENKLRKEEMLRRKLHNQVQELKGNIRVFCRVRPTIDADQAEETAKITFPETDEELKDIEVKGPEETNSLGKVTTKTHAFSFDRVFNPSNNNAEIFEEISQLIQSALDGYNVCIFAYGQTGSGKTFTMSSDDGMIPRALRQIYSTSKELESRGWKYTMEGSFVEVYNEELRDLLGKDGETNKKHEIRHDMTTCETTITDVTTVCLDSQEQVEGILAQAMARRSVAATKANERSSRSHSVFILKLSGYNSITGKKSKGTLNLVDLAGSERLSHSKVEGARLKETQNINKSLSCLGDVIGALGQQQAVTAGAAGGGVGSSRDSSSSGSGSSFGGTHIPYRNSKLTYLLQFSLGGNSKTLMFVMVAPEKKCLAETITSLKFADKVSRTRIGVARKIK
ncbi:kinesin-like nuclear fusion protein, variant 2 [Exophiala dermatitidis]|nr:kinesin-like nuclear fusion protein [Exophiala dermatitidis]KAJ4571932.1 kinesin-like nuclear fusion protein [Exophiala dermatitidis]KAJ4633490.1 kinesin-like nuclear fusion protein, variant 2 [Exophiala dermatitidis]KAJ9003791.1 kinesin-like nuclear fusion protein [Exophiala dermatitidis]